MEGFLILLSLINKLNNPISKSTLEKLAPLGLIPEVDFELFSAENSWSHKDLYPWWICGFSTVKGSCTSFFTRKRKTVSGVIVKDYTLAFEVGQKSENLHVLKLIANAIGCGKLYSETRGVSKFRLVQKDQILNVLVPFFHKYPLEGHEGLQYSIWIQIVDILHKTPRSDQRG